MFRWLTRWPREYTLSSRPKAPEGATPLDLSDLHDARHFVTRLNEAPSCRSALLGVAYDRFGPQPNRGHADVLERLAQEIAHRRILVFEGRLQRHCRQYSPAPAREPEPEEVERARPAISIKHYFALMVVEDQSEKPIANVEVEVMLEDGSMRACTTAVSVRRTAPRSPLARVAPEVQARRPEASYGETDEEGGGQAALAAVDDRRGAAGAEGMAGEWAAAGDLRPQARAVCRAGEVVAQAAG
jgi:hypothetical protein